MSLPVTIIVMGVSGCGKSTIAALLAGHLGWEFRDADDFHPPANIAKMRASIPLTDDDRAPWLRAIAGYIESLRASGGHGVVTCSALKRAYRSVLIGANRDVTLVFLEGTQAMISERLSARFGHFMPPGLLKSQLDTLQPPGDDEAPIKVSIAATPNAIADAILKELRARSQ